MSSPLLPEAIKKLENQRNIWFGSVRPDGRPHLTPVWFVWLEGKIYLSIDPKSVKASNINGNPKVVMALEDGSHPIICEGEAAILPPPISESLSAAFFMKYEWTLETEVQYNSLVEITPEKWLSW